MARQAKKENTENMDAAGNAGLPDQPDLETTVAENTAENIVPQPEQNANTEEGKDEGRLKAPATGDEDKAQEKEQEKPAGNADFCQLAGFEGPDVIPEGEAYEIEVSYLPQLESLAVLANRHRVPSWQQAALTRMMGWDDGKMVTDDEYRAALDRLKSRRLGGGRIA